MIFYFFKKGHLSWIDSCVSLSQGAVFDCCSRKAPFNSKSLKYLDFLALVTEDGNKPKDCQASNEPPSHRCYSHVFLVWLG